MIKANDPALISWVEIPGLTDFPIQNLPFGIFSKGDGPKQLASAIGGFVIDMSALEELGLFSDLNLPKGIFKASELNPFMALGKEVCHQVRRRLSDILDSAVRYGGAHEKADLFLIPADQVNMHLPVRIGDYTDFYSSKEHATNVGMMFRDPANALLPNWLHLPVGYHGRSSSIVVSGTPVRRPLGQTMPDGASAPVFGPSRLLDFELEMGFVIGKPSELGRPVPVTQAEDYIFGLFLFNDWSARDIQKWEYVPLGPFGAKNFASTMSPWIITLEALEPFRVTGPEQQPEVLPYLRQEGMHHFDIELQVDLRTPQGHSRTIAHSNCKYLYWSMAQQLAHHTITGCNLNVGDVCASGTISGPTPDSYGSMLELTWKGTKPLDMSDGTQRKFILDGDTVSMRAYSIRNGVRIGFGECDGQIIPALEFGL
jgi:fumarylacetoacetase